MGRKPTERHNLVRKYACENTSTKDYTLARLIYNENAHLFKSIEEVRQLVRLIRGHSGEKIRKKTTDKSLYTPTTHDTRNSINELVSKAPRLKTFKLPTAIKRVLFLSDIHFPYQDNDALICALEYGLEKNVDCVWLNGDILDMFQASFHEKLPNKPTIRDEFDMVRAFLQKLRKLFPKATIYFKEGNHDLRWERYLQRQAPELFGNPEFELATILRLAEYGIIPIENRTLTKFGKLNVLHGNEFKGGGGVNPARALFMRAKANTIAGDKHKSGENNEGTLDDKLITTWSVGCLCDLNPEYMPMAHTIWNHGFAYIEMDGDKFRVRNLRIKNGEIL